MPFEHSRKSYLLHVHLQTFYLVHSDLLSNWIQAIIFAMLHRVHPAEMDQSILVLILDYGVGRGGRDKMQTLSNLHIMAAQSFHLSIPRVEMHH